MKGPNIEMQLAKLEEIFSEYHGTITAFSGGVDSSLVLFLSRKFLGYNKTVGVISNSQSLKKKDYEIAVKFAREHDINLLTIETKELSDHNYNLNPVNRCYFCKSHLYNALDKISDQSEGYVILNGTNTDDIVDYRPGLQAAVEHNVDSPLLRAEMNKDHIRSMALYFDLSVWDKPASPCISSRIPYGSAVTNDKLRQIESAEDILNGFGFMNVRVRHFGKECKIEVPTDQLVELKKNLSEIISKIKTLGFQDCLIDEEGLISGKLNRKIGNAQS